MFTQGCLPFFFSIYPLLWLDHVIWRGQPCHMPHPPQVAAETKVCLLFPRGGILTVWGLGKWGSFVLLHGGGREGISYRSWG